jgi:hypothetical protein
MTLSSDLFSKVLRETDDESILSIVSQFGLQLLHYCLQDNDYNDLVGVPLVPLASNKWGTFDWTSSRVKYYLTTPDQQQILVGLESMLISCTNEDIKQVLGSVSVITRLNIVVVSCTEFGQLFNLVIPSERKNRAVLWSAPQEPFTTSWLMKLWQYLSLTTMDDLTAFHGLPIVPTQDNYLVPLMKDSPLLQGVISKDLVPIVEKLRCKLVNHSILSTVLPGSYALPVTPEGLLQAIHNVCQVDGVTVTDLSASLQSQECRILRGFFSDSTGLHKPTSIDVLRNLPLFQYIDGTDAYHSALQAEYYAPADIFVPESLRIPHVLRCWTTDITLLSLLNLQQMSGAKLYQSYLLPEISSLNEKVQAEVLDTLLKRWQQFQEEDKAFVQNIRSIPFLPNTYGQLATPISLLGKHNMCII